MLKNACNTFENKSVTKNKVKKSKSNIVKYYLILYLSISIFNSNICLSIIFTDNVKYLKGAIPREHKKAVPASRSSHQRYSLWKGVLRNFTKFTGEALAQVFPCGFCEISNNTFFTEHLWWLLLFFYLSSSSCQQSHVIK